MTLSEWLQMKLDEKGWKTAELVRRTGLPKSSVYLWVSGGRASGDRALTRDRVAALASALGAPLGEALEAAGLSDRDRAADLRAADEWAGLAYGLTAEDRATVIALVRSFRDARGYPA